MKKNKIILGSAMGLAAIAVAIDHTKHKVPAPQQTEQGVIIIEDDDDSPCGMGDSPCGLDDDSPCGMGDSPCGLDDEATPCGMDETPCGM